MAAPGDPDASIPGHLPEELPPSIGDIDSDPSVDEADERIEGDGDEDGMADHLRATDDDRRTLGRIPSEVIVRQE